MAWSVSPPWDQWVGGAGLGGAVQTPELEVICLMGGLWTTDEGVGDTVRLVVKADLTQILAEERHDLA